MTTDDGLATTISANATKVRRRIAEAASRVGRNPQAIRLVAVTKTFPVECIEAAAAAGLADIGENKVQEALSKMAHTAGLPLTWHLIGHLQANKARKAARGFAWIHSVDSVSLLRRLDAAAQEAGTRPTLLVQVDLAGESTKHGAPADAVAAILTEAGSCSAVAVRGLMVLPPWHEDPERARPYFRGLRDLRDALRRTGIPADRLHELSMGMSHDFHVAVEEGATVVRVGTALFGPRG